MLSRLTRTSLLLCLAIGLLGITMQAMAVDWKKVEEDYNATRDAWIAKGIPAYYITPTATGALVYDSRPEFGIGVHGVNEDVFANLKKANIRFIRITMYWYLLENTTTPGQYNMAEVERWDGLVKQFTQHGIIPLVVVHGNAPGSTFANRAESYQRFAKFMAFVAKRYPSVRYWELFNEMDAGFTDLFGAGVTPDVPLRQRGVYYAEMLKVAYPVIKEANPKALVLVGGMTDFSEFPQGIYDGGGKDYFDIMNLHTYGVPLQWGFVQRGVTLRQVMEKNGDAHKPLWNTEFGVEAGATVQAWGVPGNDPLGTFDKQQLEMIRDCIEFNRKAGLYQKCFAYQYAAGNEGKPEALVNAIPTLPFPAGYTIDDYGFGFVRADGKTLRPVFQYLITGKVNDPLVLGATKQRAVLVGAQRVIIPQKTDYPTEISVQ